MGEEKVKTKGRLGRERIIIIFSTCLFFECRELLEPERRNSFWSRR